MNSEQDSVLRLRTGMRRIIPPWEFRHLRVWGGARIVGGIVLVVVGVLTLTFGGNDSTTYGWAAAWLALAALALAGGLWEMTIARSAPPRT
jgi:hypothetical protein